MVKKNSLVSLPWSSKKHSWLHMEIRPKACFSKVLEDQGLCGPLATVLFPPPPILVVNAQRFGYSLWPMGKLVVLPERRLEDIFTFSSALSACHLAGRWAEARSLLRQIDGRLDRRVARGVRGTDRWDRPFRSPAVFFVVLFLGGPFSGWGRLAWRLKLTQGAFRGIARETQEEPWECFQILEVQMGMCQNMRLKTLRKSLDPNKKTPHCFCRMFLKKHTKADGRGSEPVRGERCPPKEVPAVCHLRTCAPKQGRVQTAKGTRPFLGGCSAGYVSMHFSQC